MVRKMGFIRGRQKKLMTERRQFGSHCLPPDLIYIYIYLSIYAYNSKDEVTFSLNNFAGKSMQKKA